ncbi:MAG: hypothetical protein R2837_11870 [Aliarcobacter sp.]
MKKRIDALIGKIKTTQKDIFDNLNEIYLTIDSLKLTDENKYLVYLKDEHGSVAKTPNAITLEEIEKISFN